METNFIKLLLRENLLGSRFEIYNYHPDNPEPFDEAKFGLDEQEAINQAYEIAEMVDIQISHNADITTLLIDKELKMTIGAVWTSLNSNKYFSFDLVVHPDYHNFGLGRVLMNGAVEMYDYINDEFQEMNGGKQIPVIVYAVNPIVANYLIKHHGFRVTVETSEGVRLER